MELLNYCRFVRAKRVSRDLTGAIGSLMLATLEQAVITGTQAYFLFLLGQWSEHLQKVSMGNIPGAVRLQFIIHGINDGG